MINSQKSFNIHDYIDVFLNRKWFFFIPLVLVLFSTALYAFLTPKLYKSSTLVLVSPQKIPPDLVKATVTSTVEERLSSITQEILSRTRLELVVKEFNLYADKVNSMPMESVVELMRRDIEIDVPKREKETYFTISYFGKDPKVVSQVTNKLASLFIEENLKIRAQQSQGTSEFLKSEVNAKKVLVGRAVQEITDYKRRYINELPENRDANLKVLDQLQLSSQKTGEAIRAAEDRKLIIENQLAGLAFPMTSTGLHTDPTKETAISSPVTAPSPQMVQLNRLKMNLEELRGKYTESHPDIMITKKKIDDLEKKVASVETQAKDPSSEHFNVFQADRKKQLAQIDKEINRLKKEDEKVRAMIAVYQGRIENTPIRDLNMSSMNREFSNLNESYQTLLKKSAEAQQAENLERRQKGEQFRIADPARVPEKPYKPDIPKVLLIGLVLGIGVGLGLTYIREQMDRSFRDSDDLEVTLGLRVLANIPKVDKKAA
jgi:polysaccharide chain length determinant protein (PEP-CTERM system associated)